MKRTLNNFLIAKIPIHSQIFWIPVFSISWSGLIKYQGTTKFISFVSTNMHKKAIILLF